MKLARCVLFYPAAMPRSLPRKAARSIDIESDEVEYIRVALKESLHRLNPINIAADEKCVVNLHDRHVIYIIIHHRFEVDISEWVPRVDLGPVDPREVVLVAVRKPPLARNDHVSWTPH